MSRAFFELVADALAGFVPSRLRDYAHTVTATNLKVWFEPERREHYEVQLIGRAAARAARLSMRASILEIGFHAEHPDAERNERALAALDARRSGWRRRLGTGPTAGAFIGRSSPWRRLSEVWTDPDLDDDGTAIEAADRLARYIAALEPVRRR